MNKFINERPQRLCLMCGKCCRVATTVLSYDELLMLFQNGDEGAKDFLNIFEPYSSIEEARKVSAETVDNVLRCFDGSFEEKEKITFYKCKYISANNLCGIYKKRPLLCDRFPTSPWAIVPPGCGFCGYMFKKREEYKMRVRLLKEDLIEFELMLKDEKNEEKINKIKSGIVKINEIIKLFKKYGSEDW